MTLFLSLQIFTLIYVTTQARNIWDVEHGCTAPYSLPNLPYFVVWNIPSGGCEQHGIDLNLPAYRIVTNKDDQFFGDQMAILYDTGAFPYYRGKNNTPVHGGLPQFGNVTDSLTLLKQIIQKNLPDTNFSGLAVLDWEAWRPHLPLNFDSLHIYIDKSKELVQKQHPDWTDKVIIDAEATRQFDSAARAYMQETLEVARTLHPNGHWGYYGYPRCWGPSSTNACDAGTALTNDVYMGWLFSTSTGLFPRIYTSRNSPLHDRYLYVRQQVNETLRVQVKWSGLNVPVMPYSLDQDSGTDFFQKEDLQIAVEEPADMGASGVVIWGSSGFFHTPDECNKMKENIKNNFGPFVKNLTDFAEACAQDLCHSHGRCVSKDYEATTQDFLRLYQKKSCVRPREEYENISSRRQSLFGENVYPKVMKYDNYVCRCLAGYHGEFCDKTV